MAKKTKSSHTEDQKTLSISETRKLRLKIVKPEKGIIEIVNSTDQGRVCTLNIADFRSKQDAEIYAELLKLAPELLDHYLSDKRTFDQVIELLQKSLKQAKKKRVKHQIKKPKAH